MRRKSSTKKAAELLSKLLKKTDNLELIMQQMRRKGVGPMEMCISLVKVKNMSLEEADRAVLNSQAYIDIRDETIRINNMAYGVLMDEADEIIQGPNGKKILRFDLTKETDDSDKDELE